MGHAYCLITTDWRQSAALTQGGGERIKPLCWCQRQFTFLNRIHNVKFIADFPPGGVGRTFHSGASMEGRSPGARFSVGGEEGKLLQWHARSPSEA